jgi:holin-like protein
MRMTSISTSDSTPNRPYADCSAEQQQRQSAGKEANSLIGDLIAIFGCQLAGEFAQQLTGIPVPGPILGLLLLLFLLIVRGGPSSSLQSTARGLLQYLPLLFVPAGAGVAAHLSLIGAEWVPITAALIGSSVIAILATAFTMRAVERARRKLLELNPVPSEATDRP